MKISTATHFIYIMTSSSKLEDRFILDIARCALYLTTNVKVAYDKQTIISDTPKAELETKMQFFKDFKVISSSNAYDYIKNVETDNLFIISSCHGNIYGIDAMTPIRPFQFTEAIKQNVHLKNCIAMFGQCYAGIFNHLDLMCQGKNIIYIGAAEMRAGLSSSLS